MPDNPLPPETPILTGRKLSGRYVLKTPLFLGKATQIWEADDLVLTRKVAIKLTHPQFIFESSFIREFRSRARTTAQLNHPSIVPIYDTTGDEEIEAIVMELIDGMPLRAYIDEIGTMSTGKALNVLTQVVDALQHAHQQGIIHGDLNPENIFLCSGQQVKVAGFGLATAEQILRETSSSYGEEPSPYLAPEQYDGEAPNAQSDIFSLGIVILELLTGVGPNELKQGSQNDLLKAFDESPREIPENFHEPLVKAIDRERTRRFLSPVDFRSAMNRETPQENAKNDNMDFNPKTSQRDFNQIVTAVLTIGMVFTFILGIIFAANLDDDLFGNDSSNTSVSSPPEEQSTGVEEESTGDEEPAGNEEETIEENTTPTVQEVSVSPIFEETPIVAAEDFDPLGDGVEHPELLGNLFDNDSSTLWKTETYGHRSLGFLKPGVGVVVQLEKAISLHTLEIETAAIGWSGEIYVADAIGASLEAWGEPVAFIEASSGTANIDLTGNSGLVVLVWITDLGDAPPSLKLEISEIRIT
ncbi:MAG: serine/threonine-protein kinase [Actinomycetota bacterium]|nr:serine/threonine-protein kinase [Actinomycetota bacterium]